MAVRLLNPAWTIDAATSRGAAEGPAAAGVPAEFVAEGVRVDQTVDAVAAVTRGAPPPDSLDLAVDVSPREAVYLAVRHESGALSFHLPTADRSGVGADEARFRIPIQWTGEERSRGLFAKAVKAIVLKVGEVARDRVIGKAMPWLALGLEKALWSHAGRVEGWHRVTRETLASGMLAPEDPTPGGRALLLLHGTFSHAASAFAPLAASDFFARVKDRYGDRIYAFNHFTVSRTLDENARLLLDGLPAAGLEFDVITHSRGGLVLRTLVEGAKTLGPAAKRFRLGHAVLVASPNAGTPLANPERFEDTFGWFANLLELLPDNPFTTAPAFIANGIVWLASNVVGNLPGLQAMNETQGTIKALQGPPAPTATAYSALVSNYRPDKGVLMRVADLALDAFFATANDLVVPTGGGWHVDEAARGLIPAERIGCFGSGGNIPASAVTHVGFFSQPATVDFVVTALKGEAHALHPLAPDTVLPNVQWLRDGGVEERVTARRPVKRATVDVRVINGDLVHEKVPLILGHYASMSLTGAEGYVDALLDRSLSRLLELGLYPTIPGAHHIFVGRHLKPADRWRQRLPYVIVAGLGAEGALNAQRLSTTVRSAAIGWAQHVAEEVRRSGATPPEAIDVAATLLGSGGLGVTPAQSAQLILQGILDANEALADLNERTGHRRPLIGTLRLIELYLDRAMEAWRALRPGTREDGAAYRLGDSVEQRDGALPRTVQSSYRGVDYDYVRVETRATDDGDETVAYTFDTARARTEVTAQETQVDTVRRLVEKASAVLGANDALAKTLFQMLVPVDVQPLLTGSSELQMELTDGTAGIPWELLRPPDDAQVPWAIRCKLLRRLKTADFRRVVVDADGTSPMLVIAEPACPPAYPALPQARREAIAVHARLAAQFPQAQILGEGEMRPDADAVLTRLFEGPWRVLHIAGHGRAAQLAKDGKKDRDGVLLSYGVLGAREIRAMRVVPELVFLNCCHVGQIGTSQVLAPDGPVSFDRSRFAATVARELIDIGVRCVVAAGWAVNDRLAALFATTFYDQLLYGLPFIEAVHQARLVTYRTAPEQSTWAAYQCYGDPDWRLTGAQAHVAAGPARDGDRLASRDDLLVDLDTVAAKARRDGPRSERQTREALERLEQAASAKGWAASAVVQERFAEAWKAARDLDASLKWYRAALAQPAGPASFKTAEQYANLLARRAWQRVRDAAGASRSARAKVAAGARRDIRTAQADLKRLLAVGPTAERHSLIGSSYKRLALVEARSGQRAASRTALVQARKAYANAHDRRPSFYSALNLLAVDVALGHVDGALARSCEADIKKAHADDPNFWTFVAAQDLALIRAAQRGFAGAGRIVAEYKQCFDARAGGSEWDSVYDGAEFVLFDAWHKGPAVAQARATLAALQEIVNGGAKAPPSRDAKATSSRHAKTQPSSAVKTASGRRRSRRRTTAAPRPTRTRRSSRKS